MLLSKPGLVLSSCHGLHNLGPCCTQRSTSQIHTSSTAPSPTNPRPRLSPPHPRPTCQTRYYARIAEDPKEDPLIWPEPSYPPPTPYQIFCITPTAPYSKRRFYELVKLYHPDRHHHDSSESISPTPSPHARLTSATKLERYRLVVAANDILCDPQKRSAYDRYGAGWGRYGNGGCDAGDHTHYGPWRHNTSAYSHSAGRNRGWNRHDRTNFYSREGSPHRNATWEDWERWYQRDAKGPQEPRFFANGAFVSLIVTLAALGGVGQATRAGKHTMNLLEERERLHDETSKDLVRRRRESMEAASVDGPGQRDRRIRKFLMERESNPRYLAETGELDAQSGEGYARMLPAPVEPRPDARPPPS